MNQAPKIKSLWGDLPTESSVRTPYVILKEQASILTEATNGLLFGHVSRKSIQEENYSNYDFHCWLDIEVPSINNYSISIVEIKYPIDIYPLEIYSPVVGGKPDKCHSEEKASKVLEQILSSAQVKRIILGLLSEVRLDQSEKSQF